MLIRYLVTLFSLIFFSCTVAEERTYFDWKADNYGVDAPLGGIEGDPQNGRLLANDLNKGNCTACHHIPLSGVKAFGNIGPSLRGVGARLSEGTIRLRIVNPRLLNPNTVMPAFYLRPDHVHRLAEDYWGRTLLRAQEVEDIVAYLVTLK